VNAVATDAAWDVNGRTALYIAAGDWPEIVRVLLEAGADPNGGRSEEGSPLFDAAYKGQMESASLLVAAGADVHAKGKIYGDARFPPQEMDVMSVAGLEIVRFLVDRGTLTAVLNDSDVRVRDRPTTEGSNTIGMFQKGNEVTVQMTVYQLSKRLTSFRATAFGSLPKHLPLTVLPLRRTTAPGPNRAYGSCFG